uniref:Uncharacterized protein n=1 Tax=Chromera velia CCMP2878 TaxID=1169474 RepID=A0A0G4I2K7_9ALVE|eukprot:Cvel_10393.t1-p1 / transcript=Cvel_10393.t1 / gene=Cvel_10393 / organism=Chromera_velia_CCMP2878 / gene_product=hypothetical protein / transcript_product=hypothetical protein / location=Cvel_scaffold626:54951-55253(-) / protein_length=101 / sequence_SO=supercontig / SO=protein_coding / is_pseudo=false
MECTPLSPSTAGGFLLLWWEGGQRGARPPVAAVLEFLWGSIFRDRLGGKVLFEGAVPPLEVWRDDSLHGCTRKGERGIRVGIDGNCQRKVSSGLRNRDSGV